MLHFNIQLSHYTPVLTHSPKTPVLTATVNVQKTARSAQNINASAPIRAPDRRKLKQHVVSNYSANPTQDGDLHLLMRKSLAYVDCILIKCANLFTFMFI